MKKDNYGNNHVVDDMTDDPEATMAAVKQLKDKARKAVKRTGTSYITPSACGRFMWNWLKKVKQGVTKRQIVSYMAKDTEYSPLTVQTQLGRLCMTGCVKYDSLKKRYYVGTVDPFDLVNARKPYNTSKPVSAAVQEATEKEQSKRK